MISTTTIIPISLGNHQVNDTSISSEIKKNNFIVEMIKQVNESLVKNLLEELLEYAPRFIGTKNCSLAAEYIYNHFESLDLKVEYDNWSFPIFKGTNVVGTLPGCNNESDAVIIVCAHYDTAKKSPGAIDDGSGVAAMMAIAQILSQHTYNHTIKFIAFSGEEVGAYGSYAYAKKAYESNENIRAVLNLDMIGYTLDDGDSVYVSYADRSAWIFNHIKKVANDFKNHLNLSVKPLEEYPADEKSFRDLGYDAVLIIEESIWDHVQIWNSENDTLDKVNYKYLAKITKLILSATVSLANQQIKVQLRITSPAENTVYLYNLPVLQLPAMNMQRTPFRGATYIFGSATIKVNITTDDEIELVYFLLDDRWIRISHLPPYECPIQNGQLFWLPLIGRHRIRASVFTKNHHTASDEIDLFIFKL